MAESELYRKGEAIRRKLRGEADFERIPGAHLINENEVSSGISPNYFVSTRRSAKANLFRIFLE